MQNISYFFSLQNEKYPVAKVSCNKGAEPGGKTETFLLFTLLNFKYLSNVAPQLTAAAFPRPSRRLPPVRRKRDERRDRTAVFQGSVFTEQIESRSAEPGRERFCLKAGRRIPNRSYEEYVAGRGRKSRKLGFRPLRTRGPLLVVYFESTSCMSPACSFLFIRWHLTYTELRLFNSNMIHSSRGENPSL